MVAVRRPTNTETDETSVFDDFDAAVTHAQVSFDKAAKTAVEENDRLGIPTHSSKGGKLIIRQPKAKTLAQH
jgi:hypothetical protein